MLAFALGCVDSTEPVHVSRALSDADSPLDAAPSVAGAVTVVTRLVPDKCMDVSANDRSAGVQVIIWPCHNGNNQRWALPPRGTWGEIRIFDGMCLDAYGAAGNDFDPIVTWPCHGGANQQWTLTDEGEIRGINGKCVDVLGADAADLTPLILFTCHGGANQRWDVAGPPLEDPVNPVPPGYVEVKVGDDLAAHVAMHPAGAGFYLRAGVHRQQSVAPASGSTFIGEPGAIR